MAIKSKIALRIEFYYKLLLTFTAICIISTFIMSEHNGDKIHKHKVYKERLLGPVSVRSSSQTFQLHIETVLVKTGDWLEIQIDILNQDKKHVFTISDEF